MSLKYIHMLFVMAVAELLISGLQCFMMWKPCVRLGKSVHGKKNRWECSFIHKEI